MKYTVKVDISLHAPLCKPIGFNEYEHEEEDNDDEYHECENSQKSKPQPKNLVIFFYITDKNDAVNEVELEKGSTIEQLKEKIAELEKVDTNNFVIEVYFKIVDKLRIGNDILFIQILHFEEFMKRYKRVLKYSDFDSEENSSYNECSEKRSSNDDDKESKTIINKKHKKQRI